MPSDRHPNECAKEGERRKAEVHATLEARQEPIVAAGRRVMLRLLLNGRPTATIDDVRAEVELPEGVNPTCFGAVPGRLARVGIIWAVGFVKSTRPEAHARPVTSWELVDAAAAVRWLREHPEPTPEPEAQPTLLTRGNDLPLFVQTEGGAA